MGVMSLLVGYYAKLCATMKRGLFWYNDDDQASCHCDDESTGDSLYVEPVIMDVRCCFCNRDFVVEGESVLISGGCPSCGRVVRYYPRFDVEVSEWMSR